LVEAGESIVNVHWWSNIIWDVELNSADISRELNTVRRCSKGSFFLPHGPCGTI